MDTNPLFSAALGLIAPWTVVETRFDAAAKRLELKIDFAPGSRFACLILPRFCVRVVKRL